MSSGVTHAFISTTAGIAAGSAVFSVVHNLPAAAAIAAGCLLGVIVTPDLDVALSPTHSHSVVRWRFGCLASILWWILWIPYGLLAPRHRSFLTHFPLISTAGRGGYLGTLAIGAFLLMQKGVTYTSGVPAMLFREINHWGAFLIPDLSIWPVFVGLFIVFVLVALTRFDLHSSLQRYFFWLLAGALALVAMAWAILQAFLPLPNIWLLPPLVFVLLGLCLSDTLHTLADWYLAREW